MNIKQAIEYTKDLSSKEKAFLAHFLISSLDNSQDSDIEEAWAALAGQRLDEIQSGAISAVSWSDIKQNLKD